VSRVVPAHSRRGCVAGMRKLHYAGGYMLIGDRTCKAVLRYARALADSQTSDLVSVPVVTEGGSSAYAHLLIGPASQIFATPVENSQDDPVDDDVIRDLETATLRLQPSRPVWSEELLDIPDLDLHSWAYSVAHDKGVDAEQSDTMDAAKASAHSPGTDNNDH
jgi:hypothetical protein